MVHAELHEALGAHEARPLHDAAGAPTGRRTLQGASSDCRALLEAVALAVTSLVLAWGWPRLLGSSSRFGSSFAIGTTGVLVAAATANPPRPVLLCSPNPGVFTAGAHLWLGVALGVTTLMAMVSIIEGLKGRLEREIPRDSAAW